jgi:succinoglycan biosynthesis protein ExoO
LNDGHRQPSWIALDEFIRSNCLYSRCPDLGYLKPMIRRDVLGEARLRYDETLRVGEDYNFLARLMAHGHRLLLEPTSLYLYRKHERSVSHRLRSTDITALIAAEQRFAGEGRAFRPPVRAALKRRRRTLYSLLAYDAVVAAIKNGDLVAGVGQALKRPHIWPLLMQPVMARLRRLGANRRSRDRSRGDAELQSVLPEAADVEISEAAAS